MNTKEAIKLSIDASVIVCEPYLQDLSDEELMKRPHPDCNHLIWQLGHLISSEHEMINAVVPGSMPPLPDGFVARYSREMAGCDDPSKFDTKESLLQVYRQQREGTLRALQNLNDAQLDDPSPEPMREYAPNVGAAFSMIGSHWLMHAGQWVIVRRQLGRPALF